MNLYSTKTNSRLSLLLLLSFQLISEASESPQPDTFRNGTLDWSRGLSLAEPNRTEQFRRLRNDHLSSSTDNNYKTTDTAAIESSSAAAAAAAAAAATTREEDARIISRASRRSGPNSLRLGENFFTQEQMEETNNYFQFEQHKQDFANHSLKLFAYTGASVKLHSQPWTDLFLHRYDSYKDMRVAAWPQADQELCLRQLEHLNERTQINLELGVESRDLNFLRYIDTFGRVPSGLVMGNIFWVGSYEECNRLKIELPDGEETSGRYCIASFRFSDWPRADPLEDVLVFKTGVCLPKVCDSSNYKNKFELVTRIAEYNARQVDLNVVNMLGLYCLPDEESELRSWWRSKPTAIVIGSTALWVLLLLYATYKDELNRRTKQTLDEELRRNRRSGSLSKIGLSNGFRARTTNTTTNTSEKIYRSLSITSNLRSLFSTQKSSLLEVGQAASGHKKLEVASSSEPSESLSSHTNEHPTDAADTAEKQTSTETIVDLDVIEGVKVLAAIYIISGHVLLISAQLVNNGQEMALSRSIIYTISNLMPAFAVNAFFAITGILTAYLMFKQNQSHAFITSPLKWVAFIMYRYLRIMPMYVLVTLFCKHVARYTGDGPMWDYGTSSLAARRTCEQEPWAWTLLFGANFKSPLKHCIISAWYLANDFQFFIVTPLFLAALHLRPRFGRALLMVCAAAGYLLGIWSIFVNEAPDLRPIAAFMPHGFTVYVNFLHESYTRPYYRAPAYLIGLLLGHSLFEYEQKRREHLKRIEAGEVSEHETGPGWSEGMIRNGSKISIILVASFFLVPSIGSRLPLSENFARWLVAVLLPTLHIKFTLAIGIYVLLSTTGHGSASMDWLLSRHFWKPLSRLSLCVVLVNVEVIMQIIQSSRDTKYQNNQYLAGLNLYVIVWTYTVAAIVCVIFEAPMRAALNHLLAYAVNHVATKLKKIQ